MKKLILFIAMLFALIAVSVCFASSAFASNEMRGQVRKVDGSLCNSTCQYVTQNDFTGYININGVSNNLYIQNSGTYWWNDYPSFLFGGASNPYTYNAWSLGNSNGQYDIWARQPCVGGGGYYFSPAVTVANPGYAYPERIDEKPGDFRMSPGCHPAFAIG